METKSIQEQVEEKLAENNYDEVKTWYWELKTFYNAKPYYTLLGFEQRKCYLVDLAGCWWFCFTNPFTARAFVNKITDRGVDADTLNTLNTYSWNGTVVKVPKDDIPDLKLIEMPPDTAKKKIKEYKQKKAETEKKNERRRSTLRKKHRPVYSTEERKTKKKKHGILSCLKFW